MNRRDETWVDAYGNRIPVSLMSEEYAKNVLRMLLRNGQASTKRPRNTEYRTPQTIRQLSSLNEMKSAFYVY